MAAALRHVTAVFRRTGTGLSSGSISRISGTALTLSRTAVCTSSGAILPKPRRDLRSLHLIQEQQELVQTPFGLMRIGLVVVPFLYVGTLISKNFAALLEEHDIFVPEDDDDDD